MSKYIKFFISISLAMATLFCGGSGDSGAKPTESPEGHIGKAIEVLQGGGYTYVKVKEANQEVWLAGPNTQLNVGDDIKADKGSLMSNFESRTLNRSFPWIFFVTTFNGGAGGGDSPHAGSGDAAQGNYLPTKASSEQMNVKPGSIKKADYTVEECFTNSAKLNGKVVKVRGRVVKVSPNIMGKNFVHVRDGSGKDGTNDLTITTKDLADVGKTVVVTGKLTANKDFGYGYKFAVLVEDAKLKVE